MFYRYSCSADGLAYTYLTYDFILKTATYICVNCPDTVKYRLVNGIEWQNLPVFAERPFTLDSLIVGECLKSHKDDISDDRDVLIEHVGYSDQYSRKYTKRFNLQHFGHCPRR